MRAFTQKQNQPLRESSPANTRSSAALPAAGHRVYPILKLQNTIGNQAVQRLLQAKPGGVGARDAGGAVVTPIVDETLRSPGQPLDAATKAFFEPRFGHDFARVRVHTGPQAAEAARSVSARAFTVGRQVVMGEGHYAPQTNEGRRLLAHELVHVLQQGGDGTGACIQREDDPKVAQRLGMLILTFPDGRVEATVNEPWTEKSGSGSTIIGMAAATGLSESMLVQELVDCGAYTDEKQIRGFFIEGTRIVVKGGAIEEISVRGKVYKAGGKIKPTFEDFLNEGVQVFRGADFGLCGGDKAGRDPADGYDARFWEEQKSPRGVIRARISAWDAMDKLVRNIGKEVPKAGGGTTKWSFDCFEATLILRLYAIWRTSSRAEFNSAYRPLRFGFHAGVSTGLGSSFFSDGPGQRAYHYEGTFEDGLSIDAREVFESKTMEELAAGAPVGSLVAFGSKDIKDQCNRGVPGAACAFQFENTIKLGPDRFWAHPFGAVSQGKIFREMALAAGATPSAEYSRDNLYISTIRYPR